jgi:putative FmdB family regulatory protein
MPIYEFHCSKCGADFEELTSMSGAAAVTCRHCGSKRVDRLMSSFAVQGGDAMAKAAAEPGGCGACGAPQRGMCGLDS